MSSNRMQVVSWRLYTPVRIRTCATIWLILVTVVLSGCGLRLKGVHPEQDRASGSRVVTADESLVFESKQGQIKQIYVKSSRVLPNLDMGVTPEVQSELERFMGKERSTVNDILAKGVDKFGPMVKVFEGAGIPAELISVAAVESGLNTKAASPAGAKGMWQFMKSTARLYGLRVDRRYDERTDFMRSTEAAAKHLRDLFIVFQDWHLALAAYNAGSGAINKLVSKTGGYDYWELARGGHLPGETKRFVPRVIALSLIVNDPNRYGFEGFKAVG